MEISTFSAFRVPASAFDPVHIWNKSGLLYTDKGVLDPTGQAFVGVKLFTSRKNDWNVFSAYKQQTGSDQKVIIRQLVP